MEIAFNVVGSDIFGHHYVKEVQTRAAQTSNMPNDYKIMAYFEQDFQMGTQNPEPHKGRRKKQRNILRSSWQIIYYGQHTEI